MRVLIACEESQAVCKEFRALGHEAYSCDTLPCSGGHPEWHIQGDVKEILFKPWDLVIAFPPCTYLTVSANKWLKDQPPRKSGALVGKERRYARVGAEYFFMTFTKLKCPWVIENPIGCMSSSYRKPNQVVQPWMFGHGETKATCFWINGLPNLEPTNIVEGREQNMHLLSPSKDRAKLRSKTYPGIAKAMANQWSKYLEKSSVALLT